ncbi:MAG: hypothetical protein WCJ64_17650, partial [Rhodospirillaceae bacterium]
GSGRPLRAGRPLLSGVVAAGGILRRDKISILVEVIPIGLLVEALIFRTIERHTVCKWGMPR